MSQSELPRGTRLQNNAYAVGEVLGRGGFGITYKGGDMALKRYVAIKEFFPPGAVRQNSAVVMANADNLRAGVADFLGEARVLGRFNHAGIVGVAGCFEENNTAYMVMEWIDGETLEARIAAKGRLDEWEVLDIGTRLAGALTLIHHQGVLHRDIKPENVILRKSGGAVLIDFGTARAFDSSATKMTQIVTPGYAPLEQYAQNARRGPASDIYALGATLYHALSGRKPVAATDRAADIALPPLQTLVPNLTPMFAGAVMNALQMEFARRPQSADEFAAQLRGQKAPPRRPTPPPHPATPPVPTAMDGARQRQTADEFSAELRDQKGHANHSLLPGVTPPRRPTPPPIPQAATPAPVTPQIATALPQVGDVYATDDDGQSAALRNTILERHAGSVMTVAFSPDGRRLMSADVASKICEWDWNDNTNPATGAWSAHKGGILALAYSPDGALLASGGRDERINIWDGVHLVSVNREPLASLDDCRGVVRDLAFCPARRELVVADAGALTLWNADTGAIMARRDGGAVTVSWAPDGSALAVAAVMDGALQLWNGSDLSDRGRVSAHQGSISGVAWSPDGALIATIASDGALRVWHGASGTLAWEINIGGAPECLAWSPDSRLVAVGKADTVIIRTATGAMFRSYSLRKKVGGSLERGRIEKLKFAPVVPAPYDYALAAAVRDNTVDVCRIRLQGAAGFESS